MNEVFVGIVIFRLLLLLRYRNQKLVQMSLFCQGFTLCADGGINVTSEQTMYHNIKQYARASEYAVVLLYVQCYMCIVRILNKSTLSSPKCR